MDEYKSATVAALRSGLEEGVEKLRGRSKRARMAHGMEKGW